MTALRPSHLQWVEPLSQGTWEKTGVSSGCFVVCADVPGFYDDFLIIVSVCKGESGCSRHKVEE